MKTKKLQSEETKRVVTTAKSANNGVNNASMEKTEKELTPRKILKRFLWVYAEEIAKKCFSKCKIEFGYTWSEAEEKTDGFTKVFTTADADTEKGIFPYKVINGIAFAYKVTDKSELTADDILQSFESFRMIHTAQRREDTREAKRVQKEEKINSFANREELQNVGVTPEMLQALAKAGLLKF